MNVAAPLIGFLVCLLIWWSLPSLAKIIGSLWIAGGILYLAVLTRGFRQPPAQLDFTESAEA